MGGGGRREHRREDAAVLAAVAGLALAPWSGCPDGQLGPGRGRGRRRRPAGLAESGAEPSDVKANGASCRASRRAAWGSQRGPRPPPPRPTGAAQPQADSGRRGGVEGGGTHTRTHTHTNTHTCYRPPTRPLSPRGLPRHTLSCARRSRRCARWSTLASPSARRMSRARTVARAARAACANASCAPS